MTKEGEISKEAGRILAEYFNGKREWGASMTLMVLEMVIERNRAAGNKASWERFEELIQATRLFLGVR